MSKNILVTGGSGFIGSYVVDHLIKKKYRVTVIDLLKPKRKDVKFIKSSILTVHKCSHSGEKPFQCFVCPKAFQCSLCLK